MRQIRKFLAAAFAVAFLLAPVLALGQTPQQALLLLEGSGQPRPNASFNLLSGNLPPQIVYSGPSNKTQYNAQGLLSYAPANAIRNSKATGGTPGTPGTPPNNWSPSANSDGLSVQYVGQQTLTASDGTAVTGAAYRFFGTTSGVTGPSVNAETTTAIFAPATSGQTWVSSVYSAVIAGSLPAITAHTIIQERNSSSAFLAASNSSEVSLTSTPQRVVVNRALNQATTASVTVVSVALSSLTTATAYDFTIFVGGAQLEQTLGTTTPGPLNETSGTAFFGPRFDYDPSTIDTTVQYNLVPNSRDVFASTNAPNIGLTAVLAGTGVEGGEPFADVHVSGTPTGTSASLNFSLANSTPAALGQTYYTSAYIKLQGGTLSNVANIREIVNEFVGGSNVAGLPTIINIVPTGAPLNTQPFSGSVTTTATGMSAVNFVLFFSTAVGQPVDFTLRLGNPQLRLTPNGQELVTTGTAVLPTYVKRGLEIEPTAATNLLPQSNSFGTTPWTTSGSAGSLVTAAAGLSPDGTNDAWKLTENDTTVGTHIVAQTQTKAASALNYFFEVHAKAAERSWVALQLNDGTAAATQFFNLAACAKGTGQAGTGWTINAVTATLLQNGWCQVSVNATSSALTQIIPIIEVASSDLSGSYAGTIGSGILIYQADLVQSTVLATPLPTTTAAATRAAEVATIATSAIGFNPSASTIVTGFTWGGQAPAANSRVVSTNGATAQGYPFLLQATSPASIGIFNNAGTNPVAGGTVVAGVPSKVVVAWDATTDRVALDGGSVVAGAPGTQVNNDFTLFRLGAQNSGSSPTGLIWYQSFAYFPKRLTDVQLSAVTAPIVNTVLDLNFLSGAPPPQMVFSRPSTATFYGSNGLLQTATSGTPRFDFDPATLAPKGLLIEESRTNLALQSNAFGTTWVTDANASVNSAAGTSPDGSNDAWKLLENSTTVGQHRALQNITKAASSLPYALTFFAKAAERTRVFLNITDSSANGASAFFDLAGGQIGVAASVFGTGFSAQSATIQNVGNGWYRCTLMATTNAVTTLQGQIGLDSGSGTGSGSSSYAGTIGSGVLIYQADLNQAAFPTSPIPTTTATVTRAADVVSVQRSAFPFNPAAGTFALNYIPAFSGLASTRGELLVLDDVSSSRFALRLFDTGASTYPTLVVGDGLANVNVNTTNTQTVGVLNKYAAAYGGPWTSAALNSVAPVSVNKFAADGGWTTMGIGNSGGTTVGTMWLQRLRYIPSHIPNTTLQGLNQ